MAAGNHLHLSMVEKKNRRRVNSKQVKRRHGVIYNIPHSHECTSVASTEEDSVRLYSMTVDEENNVSLIQLIQTLLMKCDNSSYAENVYAGWEDLDAKWYWPILFITRPCNFGKTTLLQALQLYCTAVYSSSTSLFVDSPITKEMLFGTACIDVGTLRCLFPKIEVEDQPKLKNMDSWRGSTIVMYTSFKNVRYTNEETFVTSVYRQLRINLQKSYLGHLEATLFDVNDFASIGARLLIEIGYLSSYGRPFLWLIDDLDALYVRSMGLVDGEVIQRSIRGLMSGIKEGCGGRLKCVVTGVSPWIMRQCVEQLNMWDIMHVDDEALRNCFGLRLSRIHKKTIVLGNVSCRVGRKYLTKRAGGYNYKGCLEYNPSFVNMVSRSLTTEFEQIVYFASFQHFIKQMRTEPALYNICVQFALCKYMHVSSMQSLYETRGCNPNSYMRVILYHAGVVCAYSSTDIPTFYSQETKDILNEEPGMYLLFPNIVMENSFKSCVGECHYKAAGFRHVVAWNAVAYVDISRNIRELCFYMQPRTHEQLVLGLFGHLLNMSDDYFVMGECSAGSGILDIALCPKNPSMMAYVLEVKKLPFGQRNGKWRFRTEIYNAFHQIWSRKYFLLFTQRGHIGPIMFVGIAFSDSAISTGFLKYNENDFLGCTCLGSSKSTCCSIIRNIECNFVDMLSTLHL